MFKSLLRTLPTLSGNMKLACEATDYIKTADSDTFISYVRNAKLVPLTRKYFQKYIPVNLLQSSYEYDVKNFYNKYSDIFFKSGFSFDKSNIQYINTNNYTFDDAQLTNSDFEFGFNRLRYSQHGYQYSLFAPIYIDNTDDIPEYITITVTFNYDGNTIHSANAELTPMEKFKKLIKKYNPAVLSGIMMNRRIFGCNTEEEFNLFDLNGDGKLNATDTVTLYNYLKKYNDGQIVTGTTTIAPEKYAKDNSFTITKYLKIYINKEAKYNYLRHYITNYVDKIDSNVVSCHPEDNNAIYYGIDLKKGGFVYKNDAMIGNIYNKQLTMNDFDGIISNGFKRNNIIMKQIMPLAFYFNVDDLLSEANRNKLQYSNIKLSAKYYNKYDEELPFYDFSIDYDYYNEDTYKINLNKSRYNYVNNGKNIMDYIASDTDGYYHYLLHEAHYINNQYYNKITPKYTRWKLKYSSDEHPYVTNMSMAYSLNQGSTYRYKEFPVLSSPTVGLANVINNNDAYEYNIIYPMGQTQQYYKDKYSNSITQYEKLMNNYQYNWFSTLSDDNLWQDVDADNYIYYNGILYNLNNALGTVENVHVDKFAVIVKPVLHNTKSNTNYTEDTTDIIKTSIYDGDITVEQASELNNKADNGLKTYSEDVDYLDDTEDNPTAHIIYKNIASKDDDIFKYTDDNKTTFETSGNLSSVKIVDNVIYYKEDESSAIYNDSDSIDELKAKSLFVDRIITRNVETGGNINMHDNVLNDGDYLYNINQTINTDLLEYNKTVQFVNTLYNIKNLSIAEGGCCVNPIRYNTDKQQFEYTPTSERTYNDSIFEIPKYININEIGLQYNEINRYISISDICKANTEYKSTSVAIPLSELTSMSYNIIDGYSLVDIYNIYDFLNDGEFILNSEDANNTSWLKTRLYSARKNSVKRALVWDAESGAFDNYNKTDVTSNYYNCFYLSDSFISYSDIESFITVLEARIAALDNTKIALINKYKNYITKLKYLIENKYYLYEPCVYKPEKITTNVFIPYYKDSDINNGNFISNDDIDDILKHDNNFIYADIYNLSIMTTGECDQWGIYYDGLSDDPDITDGFDADYKEFPIDKGVDTQQSVYKKARNILLKRQLDYDETKAVKKTTYSRIETSEAASIMKSLRTYQKNNGIAHYTGLNNISSNSDKIITKYAKFISLRHLHAYVTELHKNNYGVSNIDPYNNLYVKFRVLCNDGYSLRLRDKYVKLSDVVDISKYNSKSKLYSCFTSAAQETGIFKLRDGYHFTEEYSWLEGSSFEICYKGKFIRMDKELYDIVSLENPSIYKDVYLFRMTDDSDFSGTIKYLEDKPSNYVSTSENLTPLFNNIYIQPAKETVIMAEYSLMEISKVYINSVETYYRYDSNDMQCMIQLTNLESSFLTKLTEEETKAVNIYEMNDITGVNFLVENNELNLPEELNINTVYKDGKLYMYYLMKVDVDNSQNSFNLIGQQRINSYNNETTSPYIYSSIKYFNNINGFCITDDDFNFDKHFRWVCPFIKIQLFTKFYNIASSTMIKPAIYNIKNAWDVSQCIGYNKNITETNIVERKTQETLSFERYFSNITPLIQKRSTLRNYYMLKHMTSKGSKLLKEGIYQSIEDSPIYSADVNVNIYPGVSIWKTPSIINKNSKNYVTVESGTNNPMYPLEFKFYNSNKYIYLPSYIEYTVDKQLTYDEIVKLETEEETIAVFKEIVNKLRRNNPYNDSEILFLYNKYTVGYDTHDVALTANKQNILYKLTYKFNLI